MFMIVRVALPISKPSEEEGLLLDRMVKGRGCLSNMRGCPCFIIFVEF